ncbi:lipid A deacylase LpxR family protein [Hufsiella ginkgonis]|uniref:DUF2219 family protein n=1 Tax=Hufsiella ginkgonis TaxID=2695274 RepID=A0A7K1XYC7_9SPHI|nr:lipid A deacylase LpxR family protein [Hufsiella ginkgonis]MXV15847.1 DUF2219 family protein [Hufsiella ginkgonis]
MKIAIKTIVPLLFLLPLVAYAQDKNFRNEFGFQSDNDAYLAQGSDRYYTNGLFITFRHAITMPENAKKAIKKTWEAEVGQRMYNAQSGSVPTIGLVDRPFAAYLYAGGKLNWFYKNDKLLQFSVHGGTIGPHAFGKDVQELLHKIIGFYEIDGWQFQVNNELQLNTALSYSQLLARTSDSNADVLFETALKAGTTFSGLGAGALIRLGALNPLSGSVSANSRISASGSNAAPAKEFFFYLRPRLAYVAYDATIQGGLFSDNKGPVTYDVKPLVFSQEAGVMFAHKRWSANFSAVFQTREIESAARAHQFGTANLYYRFN